MSTHNKPHAPAINFTPLKSSQISGHYYDEPTKTLHIKFHSGGHYSYAGVEKKIADGLTAAESAGKYFTQHIRPMKFTRHDKKVDE